MRRCCLFVLVVSAALLVHAPVVGAWGVVGHRVVARIAWALMAPGSREQATGLLGGGPDAFLAAATWADEVRPDRPETYNWHFVDIQITDKTYNPARDCPATERGDCAIAAIARLRATLADRAQPTTARAEALKFLIHFIGDIHQPLHSSDNHDRGGNDVRVEALRGEDGRATNLHAAWDTGLINLSPETEVARADRLLRAIAAAPNATDLNVVRWVEANNAIAARAIYRYPGFAPGAPPADSVTLDEAYRREAMPVIDAQLTMAGVRLAAFLDDVLLPRR